jgi:hypothetical protein
LIADCLSSLDLNLRSFLGLVEGIHRCCPFVVDCFLRLVDYHGHSHQGHLESGMLARTYLRELVVTVADSEGDLVAKTEIAVVDSALGFAEQVFVPKLLGQGLVVVSVGLLRGMEIL